MEEVDEIMAQGYDDETDMVTKETEAAAVERFDALQGFDNSLLSKISQAITGTEEGSDREETE